MHPISPGGLPARPSKHALGGQLSRHTHTNATLPLTNSRGGHRRGFTAGPSTTQLRCVALGRCAGLDAAREARLCCAAGRQVGAQPISSVHPGIFSGRRGRPQPIGMISWSRHPSSSTPPPPPRDSFDHGGARTHSERGRGHGAGEGEGHGEGDGELEVGVGVQPRAEVVPRVEDGEEGVDVDCACGRGERSGVRGDRGEGEAHACCLGC